MKKLNLFDLRFMQIIFAIIITLSAHFFKEVPGEDFSFNLSPVLQYVQIIAAIFLVGLLIVEVFQAKPWIRITETIIFSLILLMFLIFDRSMMMVNAVIFVWGFFYLILILVAFLRTKSKSSGVTTIINTKEGTKETKTYPLGVFSKKQLRDRTISMVSSIIIFVILFLLVLEMENIGLKIFLIISLIIVFFMSLVIMLVLTDHFNKEIIYYYKTLDVDRINKVLEETLKENLHPDSYKYALLIKANIYLLIDEKIAKETFEMIELPENKTYQKIYEQVKIGYLISEEKYNEALDLVNAITIQNKVPASNLKLVMILIQYKLTHSPIANIETELVIKDKDVLFNKINISAFLAEYYYDMKEYLKAREMMEFVFDSAKGQEKLINDMKKMKENWIEE